MFPLKRPLFYNTQIDHIWINALLQQCHFWSIEAYWTNHKPIRIAFILQDHVLKFTLPNKIQHNLHHIHDYSIIHYQILNSAMPPCRDTLFCICNGNTLVRMTNNFSQVRSSLLNNFSKYINKIHSTSSCPARSHTFSWGFCGCFWMQGWALWALRHVKPFQEGWVET